MVRRGADATRLFRRGTRGWFGHTFASRRRAEGAATVRVAAVPGPDGSRPLVLGCSHEFGPVAGVAVRYNARFGLETGYRQLGQCWAQATSRDVVYRLLLVGLSVLIRAWWACAGTVALTAVRGHLVAMFTPTNANANAIPAAQVPTPKTHTTK